MGGFTPVFVAHVIFHSLLYILPIMDTDMQIRGRVISADDLQVIRQLLNHEGIRARTTSRGDCVACGIGDKPTAHSAKLPVAICCAHLKNAV